ncbi:MAG: MFS transporter [Melioribacteraceae bacterium]|nr:MFS transporter [Melioribacteraceae bacterium]
MNKDSKPIIAPEDRVPLKSKMAIGFGGLALFFGNFFFNNFAWPVFQMTLGVNPALLGIAMAIPRFWDAFTDPLMGKISDNTHSKYGRRRPYIVGGAILTGIMFGIVWMVPTGWSEDAILAWFVVTSILFYTCFTIFSVPLTSLTYEMTPDYNERTKVMGFFSFFFKIGEAVNQYLFPLAQLAVFGAAMVGVQYVGWGVGIFIFIIGGSLPGLLVKERYYKAASSQNKVKIWVSIKEAFKNNAFVILITLTILQTVCGIYASSLDYYLIVYHMFDGDIATGAIWKGHLTLAYAVMGFISIPVLTFISSRFSKKTALAIVYVMFLMSGVVKWFVFTPDNPIKILLDPILGAPIWIGIAMIMPAMMADVCDEDERRHHNRREGMFGALYTWFQKFGFSIAFLGAGLALNYVGFDEQLGGAQTPEAIFGMRAILAGGVVVTALIALIVLKFYPISPERALETRHILEERRGKV